MATGAVIARILTQYSDKGSKAAQKDIARLTKKFDDFGRKTRKSFALAITATAALSVKIGTEAVQAAIDDSKSQAQLALAMANTTGATKEAIAAAEDYIEKTMFRTNTADELLRASLGQLYIATSDLTEAQRLQGIALDVSAATGKDLATVTVAITRAQQGNLTALKRLSPELSGLISTGMKAEEAFALLGLTYAGSAEALANLDPLTNLKLQYGEVLETLGYELLPVIKDFAKILKEDVLPVIKEWIEANGDKLREGLRDIAELSLSLLSALGEVAGFIQRNKFWINLGLQLLVLGRAFRVIGKAITKIDEIIGALGKGFKNFGKETAKLRDKFFDFVKTTEDGSFGRFIQLIGKGASAIGKLVLGFTGLGAAFIAAKNVLKSLFGIEEKRTNQIIDTTKQIYGGAAAEKYKAEVAAAAAKKIAAARAKAAAEAAKQAAAEKKAALEKARLEAALARVRKALNAKGEIALDKETDVKQLNAAEALLKRQKTIDANDLDRLQRLKDEIISMAVRNDLAKRYQDILTALADQKIDPKEVIILAKMWEVPVEAVEAYLATIFAVEDATITDDEIVNLAMKWGSTQAQAAQYLDFFQALNDGQLSDAEINKLMTKWKLTQNEVLMYADFVGIVNDGKLEDAEIIKIQGKWKLTTDQVVDYIKKIGAPVSYSGTLIDPARAAEIGWLNATAALQRYLDLLKKGTGVVVPGNTPGGFIPGSGDDPAVIAAAAAAKAAADKAAADAAAALAESEAALAAIAAAERAAAARNYAIAKASGDMDAAAIAAAQVGPSALAAEESGAIGAASIAAALRAAEQQLQNERIMSTYASFKAKEAADALAASGTSSYANSQAADDAERARFRALTSGSTMAVASGISGGNLMAAPVVNITVQGSVTSENDLVETVRNGLLATQYNGNQINLQAI